MWKIVMPAKALVLYILYIFYFLNIVLTWKIFIFYFLNIVLTWKIVVPAKASCWREKLWCQQRLRLYIYIYIYRDDISRRRINTIGFLQGTSNILERFWGPCLPVKKWRRFPHYIYLVPAPYVLAKNEFSGQLSRCVHVHLKFVILSYYHLFNLIN